MFLRYWSYKLLLEKEIDFKLRDYLSVREGTSIYVRIAQSVLTEFEGDLLTAENGLTYLNIFLNFELHLDLLIF
ncbi:MAG: hypothetical protein R2769_02750 [Saprospiraceae bacterium]